jgi:hypothetical protein
VSLSIVVASRMSPAGMTPGPDGGYLDRARSLCVRGEELGGCLVAWSAASVALGWHTDSIEEAVSFAATVGEDALSPERAWACALAEGELESLSPDGQGILAWGPALIVATSLAEVALAGEVLVDGDVRVLRAGQLSLRGVRASADVAQSVRGWRLDLEQPWRRPHSEQGNSPDELQPTDAVAQPEESEEVDPSSDPPDETLATQIRKLAWGTESAPALDALAGLRRARARAEGGSPSVRCRASLALAMTLSIAGRAEEALFEALDALARAREAHDAKAIAACVALLAKLYAGAGHWDAATALRDSVTAV